VEFAYKPELWESLFDMVALAAVTLSGLLFVGLSINLRTVVATPAHLARAREALIALTVLLTVAIFVLIPEQGRVPLGIELLVLSIFVWVVSLRLQASTVHHLPARLRRGWIRRLIGLDSAILGITLAGASLITGRMGGFLWLLPTILICLVWSTYNAWSLMIDAMDRHQDKP
jgi:modulator of FtsH protease